MISRRNIRIKVMQTLYEHFAQSDISQDKHSRKALLQQFKLVHQLTLLSLDTIVKICNYSIKDSSNKSSKYLPTQADLNISTKIAHNIYVEKLINNPTFNATVSDLKIGNRIDDETIKKIYYLLVESDVYKKYILNASHNEIEDKKIFLYILQELISKNEDSNALFEEICLNTNDDFDNIIIWIGSHMNELQTIDFKDGISKEKQSFGKELLETVIERNYLVAEIIKPKLLNWDPERIAIIDMLLLQMGVTEFLYFPLIPTKVTINEYIDISKLYSTPQSGQFINGVLDNIHKELIAANKIKKQDFKAK